MLEYPTSESILHWLKFIVRLGLLKTPAHGPQ